jgi:hypothetical protein
MSAVIRIVCWADGRTTGVDGRYLEQWSQDPDSGALRILTVDDPSRAMSFETPGDAMAEWRQQSDERPLRHDGKPNRPLTALTVEIETLDTEGAT